ncbi:MAG: NAD-dependent epimerase/dehydratase family protein [Candidatus Eisenbacteria bacterium]|nr:NAD-dependent epimerase/dehydratase family protein [Candidatus Eisenbacteria bacterium]
MGAGARAPMRLRSSAGASAAGRWAVATARLLRAPLCAAENPPRMRGGAGDCKHGPEESAMHARALVLGATGMIGAHAARACLRHGTPVRALVRPGSDARNLRGLDLEIAEGDLRDPASLRAALLGCDLVVHAAGAYPKRLFGKARFLARARTEMQNLLDAVGAAAQQHAVRLVYVSSVTTIGRPTAETGAPRPARESDRTRPIRDPSPYFAVKALLEEMAERAAAGALDLVIVNPTFCVDDLDARRTTAQLLLPLARRQIPAYLPGHLNAVPTRDVGEGILLAARRGRRGERYILGGENLRSREFLERCARIAGVPSPRVALPIAAAEAASWTTEAWAHLTGGRPLFPMAGVRMLKHSQPFDTTRAREELGLVTSSLDDAIRRAYAWYRRNGYL